ncbi:MAG TPA: mannose-1-phosphate guanylyltransferase [Niabella sp.]|nr:mannose-1-phosphate guanylyltransferase [Niabella sp.]HOZ96455.1 mannose-1-phosphate guanylyltransferase [Niabella sp.]HQW13364.1 mannose-1-phosphate guanylyltransferase [Niabella sp.]HQX18596.1 mannose-1-phosphate guanylyltransferase [Niabella sp.]HRB06493.1 mannose-1-phosphate guanylyltransferase [Niabella sp.]
MNKNNYVAIMAGGIGSRFWPKSRTAYPKQFLDILGTGQSLIQATFERYSKVVPTENIYVVTSEDYVEIVAEQLSSLPPENIVAEPFRKNTAPCIAYISFKIHEKNPDAVMIAAPADNHIPDEENFNSVMLKALDFVTHINALITIGIKPTHPNTGYGYIQHETVEAAPGIYKVKTFTEKPNIDLAKVFLKSGDFLWNSGIFTWKCKTIINAFEQHLPEIYELFYTDKEKFNTNQETKFIQTIYSQCPSISIDFGIMEKANNVFVIPSSFSWSDLGTWNSAHANMEKDYFDNAVVGDNVMVFETHNSVIQAPDKKLILVQGLEDYIIVDTNDVLLICKKEKEQEIKDYVSEIKRTKGEKFL